MSVSPKDGADQMRPSDPLKRVCKKLVGISFIISSMLAAWGIDSDKVKWLFVENGSERHGLLSKQGWF